MLGRLSTQTRIAELRRVLRSDQKRLIDAQVARLCVLYEDLRIELFAISAESIPLLDVLEPVEENTNKEDVGKYRRHYFLRRSIGTLYEFAEGLRLLAGCPELALLLSTSDADVAEPWSAAVAFFHSKELAIRRVRHDIGGHFGSKAAIYAVENLSPMTTGKIEVRHDYASAKPRLEFRFHFAGNIAASAFLKHLPGETVQEQVETFMKDTLVEGYHHAMKSVQVLAALYLWPRFGHL